MDLLPMHSQTFNEWLLPIPAQPFLDSKKKKPIQDFKKYISKFNMLHDTSFAYDMMAYGIWYNLKYMQEKMQALQLEKQRLENELRKVTHMVNTFLNGQLH